MSGNSLGCFLIVLKHYPITPVSGPRTDPPGIPQSATRLLYLRVAVSVLDVFTVS